MTTDALLHWLLRTSLEASLLILAVLGLRLMLGTRLSPAWRIGLWMLVGTKLMLPAFIPAGFGLGAWMQNEKTPIISQTTASSAASESSVYSVPSVVEIKSASAFSTSSIRHSSFDIRHSALAVWLLGSLFVLAAALLRQRHFNRSLRRRPRANSPRLSSLLSHLSSQTGIRQAVTIVLMPAGTTPAMVGIRQPKLLLPEDWNTRFDVRSLRHVVLHELLHVKQHDLIWNWAAIAVQALHWFNPLVWFVVSRFQADRELRCDAGALALLSPTERLDYGHTLLRIQETFFAPPGIAGLAPCVRNHPTLRQRIHMIAHPTTRQPVLQTLLVLTLSVLVCYSFTTAHAAEKEVPPKVREGASAQKTPSDPSDLTDQTDAKKPAMRDGGTKKPGMRDGEGGARKSAEGEGGTRKSAEGEGTRKPGMRDGDKPRTGTRDGEGSKKTGARDGDRATSSGETITLRVIKNGDAVLIGDEEVAMGRLRGHLSTFLPDHPGARIEVTGDDDTPLKSLHQIVDAVRDNGKKKVGIKAE